MQQATQEAQLEFCTNIYGESYLFEVNQIAFDRYDSASVFKGHFEQELWDEDCFNVIIGTDSGLLVDYVLKHRKKDDSVFFFIELPELVDVIRAKVDTSTDPKVVIFSADEWQERLDDFQLMKFIYKNKLKFFESLGARFEHFPAYHKLKYDSHATMERLSFYNKVTLGSEHFVIRQMQNVCENRLPAQGLEGIFRDCSCVILAGGPSLDNCLGWVQTHRENLVVIAVSRIARRLQQVGLVPDVVVSVDPFDDSFDVSKEMLLWPSSVVFVNSYHVAPKLLGQWHGPSMYLGVRFPWHSQLNVTNFNSAGPTVTNTALSFAIAAGFSQILLAGTDMCFSSDGFTHAKGSIEAAQGPLLTAEGIWVETNQGKMAETSLQLATARERLEQSIEEEAETGVSFINLAPEGAKIRGVPYSPLESVTLLKPVTQGLERMHDYCQSLSLEEQLRQDKAVLTELIRVERDLGDVIALARKAIKINQDLYNAKGNQAKASNQLDKLQKKLDKDYEYLTKLLKIYGLNYFVSFMSPGNVDEWDDSRLEESGRLYYEAFVKSGEKLQLLLRAARLRTESRVMENDSCPSFEKLFAQWRMDKQCGRAALWIARHGSEKLNAHLQSEFHLLQQEYLQQIEANDTQHAKNIIKQTSIDNIDAKVAQLFAKRNLAALQKLAHALGLQSNQDENHRSLSHLLAGYIQVIQGNKSEALIEFEQTSLESHRSLALTQIVSLALGLKLFARALAAMTELCDFSPRFLPKLAHLQFITGDPMAAVESYNRYLGFYPKDLMVWQALAKLYMDLGAMDAVRMACEHILSMDAENVAARQMLNSVA
ncbi:6-hydroxymethylpterin diphosphokinase MptE-like protein [Shewanella cyperi]|uniref:6-hydroxymethylpterin diphosphokinase MptE-like protein n=1 Tax=Shewanella cyperi TaxID=2814292 RepID=UPI001A93F070|nr:6-hydroxymethylpterin diphosphokinase MptE-like protein [Shewanella cyperi]QSX39726.1 DUF115 domain-containing protein [Shewanella cyperi]